MASFELLGDPALHVSRTALLIWSQCMCQHVTAITNLGTMQFRVLFQPYSNSTCELNTRLHFNIAKVYVCLSLCQLFHDIVIPHYLYMEPN
jgi:hypothetical protein